MSANCCVPRASLPNGDALDAHGPAVPSRTRPAAGKSLRCPRARKCPFAPPQRSRARSSLMRARNIEARQVPRGSEPTPRIGREATQSSRHTDSTAQGTDLGLLHLLPQRSSICASPVDRFEPARERRASTLDQNHRVSADHFPCEPLTDSENLRVLRPQIRGAGMKRDARRTTASMKPLLRS